MKLMMIATSLFSAMILFTACKKDKNVTTLVGTWHVDTLVTHNYTNGVYQNTHTFFDTVSWDKYEFNSNGLMILGHTLVTLEQVYSWTHSSGSFFLSSSGSTTSTEYRYHGDILTNMVWYRTASWTSTVTGNTYIDSMEYYVTKH